MTTLHPARTDDAGRTYYEPVLARITGVSQYREDEYRLEGIEGFWAPGKNVTVPPILKEGGIAWFTLATKLKSGNNAKPGSLYRDIVKLAPATAEDKEAYNPHSDDMFAEAPQTHATGAGNGTGADYAEKRAAGPQGAPALPPLEQRILLGMAFNNLTALLASGWEALYQVGRDGIAFRMEGDITIFHQDEWPKLQKLWHKWFHEASQGRPLSPVQPPQDEGQASELAPDQDSPMVTVVDGEERTSLPW